MAIEAIALDSSPVGLLCHPDATDPEVLAIRQWTWAHLAADRTIYVPEIVDYELRRGFLRRRNRKSLLRLDAIAGELEFLPLTSAVLRKAAEFWAHAWQTGRPSAPEEALDADVILAAQAESVRAIVATENVRHLVRFVPARRWQDIPPAGGE